MQKIVFLENNTYRILEKLKKQTKKSRKAKEYEEKSW